MSPRLRLGLTIAAVISVVGFGLFELVVSVARPFGTYSRDHWVNYDTYQVVSEIGDRASVEQQLKNTRPGWDAKPLSGTGECAAAARLRGSKPEICRAADYEIAYQFRATGPYPPGTAPLRIIVVYDAHDRVVTAAPSD